MRKIISSLLAGATVLSMASMAAFAAAGDMDATKATMDKGSSAGTRTILNDGDTIVSDSSVHIALPDDLIDGASAQLEKNMFANKDLFSVSVKKLEGSKVISGTSVVEKERDNTVAGREVYLKVSIKELMDDSDNKVEVEVTIKPKSDAVKAFPALDGKKYTFTRKFFVQNGEDTADKDYMAGQGSGSVLKPQANEDNEILWENENAEIARLTFEGDSDASSFYPKLSTSWDNDQYADVIGNADAFTLDFVGRPAISSTSRATLEVYNPFYDRDADKLTVANEDLLVYEEIDGQLVDITGKVNARVNEDGDNVLVLRTRYLGKYVITDGTAAVDTGMADETDATTETETETQAAGDKTNPGTGF